MPPDCALAGRAPTAAAVASKPPALGKHRAATQHAKLARAANLTYLNCGIITPVRITIRITWVPRRGSALGADLISANLLSLEGSQIAQCTK